MVEKIKKVVLSPLFAVAVCAVVGIALVIELHPLYGGAAFGFGVGKFLDAFRD